MLRPVLPLLVLLAGATPCLGATRTSAFAPNDPGVRASALGGAFTAIGGEPVAMYWNPASLYYLQGRQVEASYADLYGIGLARRTFLTLGVKTTIEEPGVQGDRIVVRRDEQTGLAYAAGIQSLFVDLDDSGYSELGIGGSAAWSYGDRLAVGATLRALFISSDFDDVSAIGYDLGAGLSWQYSPRERVGLAVPHLLSRLFWKFDSTERLPFSAVVGWTRTFPARVLLAAEAEWREGEDSPYRAALGVEWWAARDRLALRTGFRSLSGGVDSVHRPTFGAGVLFGRLRVDYAFRLGPDLLGDTHRVGVLLGL